MECIRVRGGRRLVGRVEIEGAKNAALPILAASVLAEGEEGVVLHNVPPVSDVLLMAELLNGLGSRVTVNQERKLARVHSAGPLGWEVGDLARSLRASVLLLGALVSRAGRARVPAPGGCRIGARPVQLHVLGLRALGASVTVHEHDHCIEAHAPHGLHGANIDLEFPSVGATQNIILAAVKANGTTVIQNAAREPEVVDLVEFLCKMGAKIDGAGTETITIEGVGRLRGAEHVVVQDRIEAGTFMLAAALTGGDVLVAGAALQHHTALVKVLRGAGAQVRAQRGGVRVRGGRVIRPVAVSTAPYPGFPTDLQAPLSALLLHAAGVSVVTETLFEDRFQHLEELRRMGAAVRVEGRSAYLSGAQPLRGAAVCARELRGAAALLLAGLRARTATTLLQLHHLDRGYYRIHDKLRLLGADIERTTINAHETIIDQKFKHICE